LKQEFHVRFIRLAPWQIALAAGLALVLVGAIVFLTLGVLLIVLPIALIGSVLYYLFGGTRPRSPGKPSVEVIEGEYRVIEPRELEQDQNERP
jgi:hypothetical protein